MRVAGGYPHIGRTLEVQRPRIGGTGAAIL